MRDDDCSAAIDQLHIVPLASQAPYHMDRVCRTVERRGKRERRRETFIRKKGRGDGCHQKIDPKIELNGFPEDEEVHDPSVTWPPDSFEIRLAAVLDASLACVSGRKKSHWNNVAGFS